METIDKLREMVKVQGGGGNWDSSPYMRGMYNGMELMLAVTEDREPRYRDAPERYLFNDEIHPSPSTLTDEIKAIINRRSRENESNTPDFILAEHVVACLEAMEELVKHRDKWYGIQPQPGHPFARLDGTCGCHPEALG